MADQYDFRNVTIPLGQLIFRKRNERWRNEAEDADMRRRILETEAAEGARRITAERNFTLADDLEKQQQERFQPLIEDALLGDALANAAGAGPVTPSVLAGAKSKARLGGLLATIPQGPRVLGSMYDLEALKANRQLRQDQLEETKRRTTAQFIGSLGRLLDAGAITEEQVRDLLEQELPNIVTANKVNLAPTPVVPSAPAKTGLGGFGRNTTPAARPLNAPPPGTRIPLSTKSADPVKRLEQVLQEKLNAKGAK